MRTWRWFSLFTMMTFAVVGWLVYELGFFSNNVVASERPEPENPDTLQQSLREKSKQLQERELRLAKRESDLNEKERILGQQMARYERIIKDLKGKVTELDLLKDERLTQFRQVYEKMDPKKAAKIVEEMNGDLAVEILEGMKGDRAADILGHMAPGKAKLLTERSLKRKNFSKVNEVKSNE
jgi:flagellar motility protein MotE (MotC chaperone)